MTSRQQKRKMAHIFAHEVFHARDHQGFTQQEIADQVFISLRWYQKIEAGEVLPGFFVGVHLMELFKIAPETLVAEIKSAIAESAS